MILLEFAGFLVRNGVVILDGIEIEYNMEAMA